MTAALPLEEAQARLLALAKPLEAETVPVEAALGRYTSAPVLARRTQPAADLSAMDGYALLGPGPWTVIGESRAGRPFAGAVRAGAGFAAFLRVEVAKWAEVVRVSGASAD
ncbi:hypothetical protein J4558_15005 [Leptolyngbya sp. 15MV]|nr:hypothetical protein J4558_15005 [Leptolyngbya sp. 15MV]